MAIDPSANFILVDEGWYTDIQRGEVWSTTSGHYAVDDWTLHDIDVGRASHTIVLNTRDRRFLEYGGQNTNTGDTYSDTKWMSAISPNWASLTTTNDPPARYAHAAVYDPNFDRMIIFGGLGSTSVYGDLWELPFQDTQELRPATPALTAEHEGGNHSAMVYVTSTGADSLQGRAVEYDLRHSLTRILTESNFTSATQVSGEPTPGWPGSYDLINVSTLGNCKTYYFRVKIKDAYGNWSAMSNLDSVDTFCSGGFSASHEVAPVEFNLSTPRPNPTAGTSTMQFGITAAQSGKTLDLGIYDAAGRRVRSLRHEPAVSGQFDAVWDGNRQDGSRASAGIYFIRLNVGGEQRTRTITLQ
jgi:hypothetical protein